MSVTLKLHGTGRGVSVAIRDESPQEVRKGQGTSTFQGLSCSDDRALSHGSVACRGEAGNDQEITDSNSETHVSVVVVGTLQCRFRGI